MGPTTKSYFGDFCFEDFGIVIESITDTLPEMRQTLVERSGGDGSMLQSLLLAPRVITLECRVFRDRWDGFDRALDELVLVLSGRDDRELLLRNHPGEHYLAHMNSVVVGERVGGTGIGAVTVTLTATDPIRYSSAQEVDVPSGGSAEFVVGGTYIADVRVMSDAARRDSSSQLWGVTFDGAEKLHVPIQSSGAVAVDIDCRTRSVKAGGATTMITLDSDWPIVSPGVHRVSMDKGTGSARIVITERCI